MKPVPHQDTKPSSSEAQQARAYVRDHKGLPDLVEIGQATGLIDNGQPPQVDDLMRVFMALATG